MDEDAISHYVSKGMTRRQACATLGIPYTPERAALSVDKDTLKAMAIDTLAALIERMQANPAEHKPSDIIAACREALDRTEGKAAQTVHVEQVNTIRYDALASLPPADAYQRMLGGKLKVIDVMPTQDDETAIDIMSPDQGGGVGGKQAAGQIISEAPSQTTHPLGVI